MDEARRDGEAAMGGRTACAEAGVSDSDRQISTERVVQSPMHDK